MKRGRRALSSSKAANESGEETTEVARLPPAKKQKPEKEVLKKEEQKEEPVAEVKTEVITGEVAPLTRAQIKSAKIAKLKELLSCIQAYAQFTSSQLVKSKDAVDKTKGGKQPEKIFTGELRPYQVEGVRWLRMLHDLAVNGVLADEMGLGKTVMVISMISQVIQSGAPGPFLVIAPLSTLPNWLLEVQRFIPDIPFVLYHGTEKTRKALRPEIEATCRLPKKYQPAEKVRPIVITSYEVVIRDASYLSRIDWRMLVVDEAQRLKNENCVLRSKLRKFSTARRLILTGTPIQNSLTELWSLMSFLMPDIFNTRLSSFESLLDEILSDDASLWVTDETDAAQKEEIVALLHSILRPFILRRLKCDVDLTIPPKKEIVVRCALSKKQAELYGKLIDFTIAVSERSKRGEDVNDSFSSNEENQSDGKRQRQRQQTVFFGVNDEEEQADSAEAAKGGSYFEAKRDGDDDKEGGSDDDDNDDEEDEEDETEREKSVDFWIESCGSWGLRNLMMQLRKCVNHPYLFRNRYFINEEFVNSSCKLRLLDCMLKDLLRNPSDGHKVIIYSQFVMILDVLAQYMELRNWKFVRIDGTTSLEDRGKAIKTFSMDPTVCVFLVSTRAGGLGINLTAADTVFLYDSDWNPQMDLQARDRCHRIGQTRPVVIYRLIAANTIDERMFECAIGKRRLERVVLHQAVFQNAADSLLCAASSSDEPSKQAADNQHQNQKFSFTVDDLLTLLKQRDWEERDDTALNFDGPKEEVKRRVAELLDRSDLREEWRKTQGENKKKADLEAAAA